MIKKIAIIGAGNMGHALIQGFIKSQLIQASNITVFDPNPAVRERIPGAVRLASDEQDAIAEADTVFLVVKPFLIKDVLLQLKGHIQQQQLLVSIAAGIGAGDIHAILPAHPIVLAMPNTGISVGESMTCLASPNAGKQALESLQELFSAVGQCFIVDEKQMSAATAIGGCGTAFGLNFIHATCKAGVEMGIKPEQAMQMAAQITLGASRIILETHAHPASEIDKITTPGGITITGLNEMEHQGFSSATIKGLMKAFQKANPGANK